MKDDTQRTLGRIEATQVEMRREMNEKFQASHERFDKIESYLANDNKEKWMKKGAVVILSFIGSGFVTGLTLIIMWIRG